VGFRRGFKLSSNFTDLVYLSTMSKLSQPPSLIMCSTAIDLAINAQGIIKGKGPRIVFNHRDLFPATKGLN
jgi:hypothetical protein